ncbi:type II toxin-antitoxin system HicB family antitoxin [Methylobacterium sp. J-076]|uniref:type II toxin-antitoxin system HicB family antitoxin n=1 Tax=Methylobacterium sp. J-076 TaxID=2836655 RepID=UPI001FB8C0F3|nr:type II toxin-antitoxin system HicB family antitoxin [Methylobacterium sp. J-076]MCJ2014882.1 type II toxin-antitoxin system HicB family antitoxin [Methylobacterium sp. J-076]
MPYIAFVHPPSDGSEWGVTFPDIVGCVSGGPSFEAAVDAAREALAGHLAFLATEGDPLPPARSWADIQADPATAAEAEGAITQLILPGGPTEARVNIDVAIDERVLRLTDAAARARGVSRSAFVEAALSAAAEASL